jgi:periplasmic copper chaperone A
LRQFFAVAAVLALGGCNAKGVEGVKDAQVSLPAVPGQPGAAYFTLTGGEKENRLMQVSAAQAVRVELHESMTKGGMISMAPIEGGIAVPAGGTVTFKPGGKHAMLFDINPAAKAGGTMKLSFTYSDGRVIEADAAVKAAGDVTEHSH